jgi:scyllo-inositol 2-dehydrogenase (NADP+)
MKTLRTAVIGLGRIGWACHVPNTVNHNGFELIAAVDPVEERRKEAEQKYNINTYADTSALFDSENLDLAVIASPSKFHREQTVQSIEAGCNVFCDKPMALSLEDADAMIDCAKKHNKKLMVYQPCRGSAAVQVLKDALSQNLIGEVYMIKLAQSRYRRRNDWQSLRKYGGGMLNNYAAHDVDLLLYLTEFRVSRLHCALRTVASLGDAEDVVKLTMETNKGVILDLDINMACSHNMRRWLVMGKTGSMVLNDAENVWEVAYFDPNELENKTAQTTLAAENRKYDSGEIIPWREKKIPVPADKQVDFYRNCYDYFALDKQPFVPVEQTREVMRVIDTCRKTS